MPDPWLQADIQVNSAGRVRTEPGWKLDLGWSKQLKDCDLWLVWAGRGRMKTHNGVIELYPGVCLWMRPGGLYLAEHDPQLRLGVNYVHFDLLDRRNRVRSQAWSPRQHVFTVTNMTMIEAVTSRLAQDFAHLKNAAPAQQYRLAEKASHLLRGVLLDLTGDMQAHDDQPMSGTRLHQHQWVHRIADQLREQPAQSFSLAQTARQAGYSPDHFGKLFRRIIGTSPHEYAIDCKIQRAGQLLRESALSVKQVAEALGYRDIYFFSRQFKARTGRSPTQWRRQ